MDVVKMLKDRNVSIKYISRKENKCADWVAKGIRKLYCNELCFENIPDALAKLMEFDVMSDF